MSILALSRSVGRADILPLPKRRDRRAREIKVPKRRDGTKWELEWGCVLLKEINKVDNLQDDLFAFKINYNDADTATDLFNGNISETYWKTSTDNKKRKYDYKYDDLNRLLQADYSKQGNTTFNSYLEHLWYDKNGNIKNLLRNGGMDTDGYQFANPIDNLTYLYDTDNKNQLLRVFDATANPQGFKDDPNGTSIATEISQAPDYGYDANGNMIRDDNKGIKTITYNHLNLPTKITFANPNNITYLYNATGQKVNKVVTEKIGTQTIITTTDYLSGFQYVNDVMQFFPHAEGYVKVTGTSYDYVYNYTDHLGNIRLSYSKEPASNALKVIEENHYYPFGLKHTGYNSDKYYIAPRPGRPGSGYYDYSEIEFIPYNPANFNASLNYDYKYNGKEYQDELGLNMYDYGARNYDAALGRWMNIDPLAEMSRRCSPYVYALNNPVFFIDPDGMLSQSAIDDLWNKSGSGKTKWTFNGDGTASGSNGATANVGEDDQEKQKGVTPVNEKNKKNISKSSYGETAGLYPVKTGKDKDGKKIQPKLKDLFNPNSWDADLLKQLLKARAAINLLAARGASLHTDSPDLNDPVEKLLAAYHLTDNLPEVDSEIKDDKDVMFFYLSSDKNKKTPSISSKYWDQTTVKTYGPFYSIGGGDAGSGAIYILFYKAVKKQ